MDRSVYVSVIVSILSYVWRSALLVTPLVSMATVDAPQAPVLDWLSRSRCNLFRLDHEDFTQYGRNNRECFLAAGGGTDV